MNKANATNNVFSINNRRQRTASNVRDPKPGGDFLTSKFYLHNRKEDYEDRFLFWGAVMTASVIPLFISLQFFGIIAFTVILNGLAIGTLIGVINFEFSKYKTENYSNEEFVPEVILENVSDVIELKQAS